MPDATRKRRQSLREAGQRYRDKLTPEQRKAKAHRGALRKFGITPEQFEARLILQDGRCATCRRLPSKSSNGKRTLAVDHDHTTGQTRGLLCQRCNTALGQLHDDVHTLRNMIRYLEIHGK